MVFSKSWCGYCSKAKKVLRKYVGKELDAADLVVMEIENDRDCDAIQNYLQQITGARSVRLFPPFQVFNPSWGYSRHLRRLCGGGRGHKVCGCPTA